MALMSGCVLIPICLCVFKKCGSFPFFSDLRCLPLSECACEFGTYLENGSLLGFCDPFQVSQTGGTTGSFKCFSFQTLLT